MTAANAKDIKRQLMTHLRAAASDGITFRRLCVLVCATDKTVAKYLAELENTHEAEKVRAGRNVLWFVVGMAPSADEVIRRQQAAQRKPSKPKAAKPVAVAKMGDRGARMSANRKLIEKSLAESTHRTWTVAQIKKEIVNSVTVPNYIESMRNIGLLRFICKDERGHSVYAWHTSSIQPERSRADVVPPRVYVNSTMPNGDTAYWQRAMSWGR